MTDDTDTAAPKPNPEAEVYSATYVRELRAEAKGYRLKVAEHETAAKAAADAAEKATKEAEQRVAEAHSAAEQRVIRAELKALAIKHGMVDLDGLKLLDLSQVKLTDDGSIEGADALFETAKTNKPYLFGKAQSTSSTFEAPRPAPSTPKLAKDMTPAEREAALNRIKRMGR